MMRRPPRSTRVRSSAASDVYKRQGLARRIHRGRAGALEEAEEDEPYRVRGREEEQSGETVDPHSRDKHRLAADPVAQTPEERREGERAYVVGRRYDADVADGGGGLLLQEYRKVGEDGSEARPDH